ncbi:hypothetical protein D3C87_20180 [compost metagenome]
MEELLDQATTPKKKTLQFRWETILIWGLLFFIGYLFKFMHWPFANIFKLIGAGGFMAYSLSCLLLVNKRTFSLVVCNVLSLFWILIIIWGAFFNDGYPLNFAGLGAQVILLGILFVLHFGILLIIKKVRKIQK